MIYCCCLTNSLSVYFDKYPVLFTLLIVLCIILQVFIAVIPAGPIQFLAGAMYGPFIGSIICICSFIIGSLIVFLITKKYGYGIIGHFVNKNDIDKFQFIINSNKSKILFAIIFIIPGSPKDVLSYIVGLTDISLCQFLLINIIGRIPSTFLTAYSGTLFINNQLINSVNVLVVLLIITFIGYVVHKIVTKYK